MQNFDYMTPTRLIFGKESIVKLPSVMAQFGKRILLTYGGGSIKRIGLYDRVKELLEDSLVMEWIKESYHLVASKLPKIVRQKYI